MLTEQDTNGEDLFHMDVDEVLSKPIMIPAPLVRFLHEIETLRNLGVDGQFVMPDYPKLQNIFLDLFPEEVKKAVVVEQEARKTARQSQLGQDQDNAAVDEDNDDFLTNNHADQPRYGSIMSTSTPSRAGFTTSDVNDGSAFNFHALQDPVQVDQVPKRRGIPAKFGGPAPGKLSPQASFGDCSTKAPPTNSNGSICYGSSATPDALTPEDQGDLAPLGKQSFVGQAISSLNGWMGSWNGGDKKDAPDSGANASKTFRKKRESKSSMFQPPCCK